MGWNRSAEEKTPDENLAAFFQGASGFAAECPGVSVDTIRRVLKKLRGERVECLGRGQHAKWRRLN